MAKILTCDFCNFVLDLEDVATNQKGWNKLKLDCRTSVGQVGGGVWKMDVCPKCVDHLKFFGSKGRAVGFLKAAANAIHQNKEISNGSTDLPVQETGSASGPHMVLPVQSPNQGGPADHKK